MNDVSVTTILLVEDEPVIAIDEKKVLEKYGYRVILAYTGEEAVETVSSHPEIDLVLMDIDLGKGMDGTQAAEIILKKRDLPLIFLSSHTEPETVEKTDSISSFGYITKMSGETILIAGIKMAFRLFQSRQKEKLKEAALGQNQYFLHKAQKLGKIGHFSYDPESGIFEGSPELYRIFDLDQDHEGFRSITKAFHPEDRERIFASLDRTIREGVPFDMEHRIVQGGGTVLLVKVKAEMTQTIHGNRLVGIVQDITDIKAAEEALIKSREMFRQLVEYAPCGIILLDTDATITEVNQKQLDFLGKTREDILGKNFARVLSVYGLDVKAMLERFKKRVNGHVEKVEYTFYEQNGRLVTAEAQTAPIIERGDITGIIYLINDISERKKLTQTLRLQFEHSPDHILIIDRDYKIEIINHTEKDGFTVDDIIGMSAVAILPAEHQAMVKETIDRCIETGQRQDLEHLIDEGKWAHARFVPMFAGKEVVQVMIISTDITEQKQTREKLAKSRALLAETERIGRIGGWDFNAETRELTWTEEVFRILELDPDKGEPDLAEAFSYVSHATRSEGQTALDRAISLGAPIDQEWEVITAKGNRRWIHVTAKARMENGVIVSVSGSMQDITDRKRAEDAAKKSEDAFAKIFNLIPDPIAITTLKEGRHLAVNDAYLKKIGYTRDEIFRMTTLDMNIWIDQEERRRFIGELSARGFVKNYEMQLQIRSGEIRDILLSSEIIEFEGEECCLSSVIDITERKSEEQAVKKSEEKFARAFMMTPEAMSIASMKDGRFIEVNDSFVNKTGYTRDELIGRNSGELGLWEIPEERKRYVNELTGRGSVKDYTARFRMSSGEVRDFIVSGEIIELEGEKCCLNFMLDITERKKAEEALLKSEEKFFRAFRANPEAMSITEIKSGRFIEVNDALLKKTGYTREEVIGRTSVELNIWVTPEEREHFYTEMTGRGYLRDLETRFRMHNGEVRIFYFSSEIIELDGEKCALNFMLDITEQKKAEKDRKKSEEMFLKVFQASPEPLTIVSMEDGRFIEVNDAFLNKAGFTRDEIIGSTSAELNLWGKPEDRTQFFDELKSKGYMKNYETSYRSKNGELRDYLVSSEVIELDGVRCMLSFVIDINERKLAEEAIKRSEEKFIKIFKTSPESITIISMQDGRFIEANDAFLKKAGFTRDEVIGNTSIALNIWVTSEERERFIHELKSNGYLRNFETQYRSSIGEIRDYMVSSEIIELAGEKCSLSFIVDITERKKAEERVKALLAEKELLLKEMNHRVKNNMNTISSLLSLQCDTLTEPSAINALNDAKGRIDSIRSLHDRLYKSDSYKEISVTSYLPALVDDIIANFPSNISITLNKDIDDFIIDAKRLQPLGIITNELLTNIMKYAFPDKKEGEVSVSLKLLNNEVVLTVQDTGIGMPESVGFDNTSGFGLMLVNILSQQLRGNIHIERSNGTAFVLAFPYKKIQK